MKRTFYILGLALVMLASTSIVHAQGIDNTGATPPASSDAYQFRRQGVFGCSQTGSYSMSVGSLSAVGGVYVPVNDAAVTLNTGYLVYKECVLRGVVNRQREAATAGTIKQVVNTVNTGRYGNPLYSQRIGSEQLDVYDRGIVRTLQNGALDVVDPAFGTAVKRAIAQGYRLSRNTPTARLVCGYEGNLQDALSGKDFSFKIIGELMNPACNPYFAYDMANDYANDIAAYDVNNLMTRLGWGEGYFPVEECDDTGECVTVTPGSLVRENFTQAIQSGFSQLERANDIDQMVNALFSGMTSQVLADNRGLLGLQQQTGTQPSYIDQLVREAAQGLRDAAGNAALQILGAAKQIETAFKQTMEAIAGVLVATIQDLRTKEAACWNLIIDNVCATPLAADKTCTEKVGGCTTDPTTGEQTCPTAGKLKVATSTTRSQQIINSRVAPLASSTQTNIEKSDTALTLLDRLIAGITNTNSVDAQRVALQQLDNLVAQRALHNQYDLQSAQGAKEDITASMETLRTDTVKAWADSTDVNTGWCNVNNSALLSFWKQQWKQ